MNVHIMTHTDFCGRFYKVNFKDVRPQQYFVADFVKIIIISVTHGHRRMHIYFVADFIKIIIISGTHGYFVVDFIKIIIILGPHGRRRMHI